MFALSPSDSRPASGVQSRAPGQPQGRGRGVPRLLGVLSALTAQPLAELAGAAGRAAYDRDMPRRLAAGTARDLVRAERDIRGRIGDQPLDFAAMAAVSNIYRAANVIRNHMERKVLADEDLS